MISSTREGVQGPYAVLMRIPELAKQMAELGDYFRHAGLLPAAERELAILAVSREMGSKYEWFRHEPMAVKSGLRSAAIEAVRRMSYSSLTERELTIVEVVQSLIRAKLLPRSLYDTAILDLGENLLVELVALTGFYSSIALILLSFDLSLPKGTTDPF